MTPSATTVSAFRLRARSWLRDNMPARQDATPRAGDRIDLERALQRQLFDGGFAGITYPTEFGGAGLTREHQEVFGQEAAEYELPTTIGVTLGILGPTLLDFGSERQKARHIPAMLRGDELWVQLLSEPTGGSDLAGAITRADRDGDHWILNGSKVWSTGAHFADYGMCLARTDWAVPKHQGLSVFIVSLRAAGVSVQQIRQVDGNAEFCQEFFDDVVLDDDSLVGVLNNGWSVASQLLIHERIATGGMGMDGGLIAGRPVAGANAEAGLIRRRKQHTELVRLAIEQDRSSDPRARDAAVEAFVISVAETHLLERVIAGMHSGAMPGPAGSILKLFNTTNMLRRAELALEILGADGVAWPAEEDARLMWGTRFIASRAGTIGGGTSEIQRNIISERLLGLPREPTVDRDVPFRDVRHNTVQREPRDL